MLISDIFKNSSYGDSLFTTDEITAIEQRIITRTLKGKATETAYVKCLIRNKEIKLTPEEIIRQLYIFHLTNSYGYSANRLQVEYPVHFGREVKRADIVVMDKLDPTAVYIIVEVKKPKLKDGKEQLKSYTNATGAPIAVWTNGEQISCYSRKDPNNFEQLTDIPKATEKLSDILNERINYEELKLRDKIAKEKRSLRDLVIEIEDEVLANAGVDSFEEVFKLIFSKLYDELVGANDPNYYLQFRKSGDTDSELKAKIEELFKSAKKKWNGIFPDGDNILLTPSHLSVCVSTLQDVKLFNNNLDVVDDAFEYLMSKSQKGEKGQYFTPRYVIDMCVKMMNPQEGENIIDTAAGSSGFPVHAIFHVWKNIRKEMNLPVGEGFATEMRTEREISFVRDHVFAIDFDEKTVRVARTLNLIAGDGQSNVLHLNTLDYGRWSEVTGGRIWRRNYNSGFERLLDIRPDDAVDDDYSLFSFDLLMANPPFAGDIKEGTILARYELGKNDKGKQQNKVGRDILFIERNLSFLKPGGRMAIVLPQGRFNNSSDKRIRDYIAQRCRILAVVGLHGNVFKPHTGTKTSVLFVQKWDEKLCPQQDDYPIFFATMQKSSKDNSGDKIYVKGLDGEPLLDSHGHLIVDHDLYNHDDMTADGIAEAFIEFAKRERLSFFVNARPFDAERYTALMSGLEAVEIRLSELEFSGRIDSEYYKKALLKWEIMITGRTHKTLSEVASFLIGPFGSSYDTENYVELSDYRYVRGQDVKPFILMDNETRYIEKADYERLSRYALKENDILVSVVGTLGNACIVRQNDIPAIFSCKSTVIRAIGINAHYLISYLNSTHGRQLLLRKERGAIQKGLNLDDLRLMIIPVFSSDFEKKIEQCVVDANENLYRAKDIYAAAESRLLCALDMDGFAPSKDPVSVKSFSESFGASGRLDAEYYQREYEDIENAIGVFDTVFCQINDGKFIPRDSEYKYIELADIGTSGNITGCTVAPFAELPSRARRLVKKGQAIVSSIEGSLASCAIIPDEYDGAICSTGFHLVDTKVMNAETLLVLFKSEPIQALMKKRCAGTILTAISKSELEQMPLPKINHATQQQIANDVQQSFALRRQSEQLLEAAKMAVEIAIEDGEAAAMVWLENATSDYADVGIQTAEIELSKADIKKIPIKTDDYYDQRFDLWLQNQGLAARGDIDRQTLREIFDAMDDDDK